MLTVLAIPITFLRMGAEDVEREGEREVVGRKEGRLKAGLKGVRFLGVLDGWMDGFFFVYV